MKTFKIRCSQIGKIMTEPKTKEAKSLGLLSETAKSYCDNWIKEQVYNRKKEFSSKTTEKGIIVEDSSIDFISEFLGFEMLMKNEEHFEDEYMTGTPDIVLRSDDLIIDAKNSWDCFTFPLLEEELPTLDYYWQAQGYLNLTGLNNYKVVYVLSDTPLNIIEREAYWYCKNNGFEELDAEILEAFQLKMTYAGIPTKYKIKIFDIKRDDTNIARVKERVSQCRRYAQEQIDKFGLQ